MQQLHFNQNKITQVSKKGEKNMLEKIQEMIAEALGIEQEKVTAEASFKDDLGADSLDLFELVMALEDEFGVEIPTEELEAMATVGDVVKYIEQNQ